VRESDGGVILRVRVIPRASSNRLAGLRSGALVIHLTAPPVEGEANQSLQRFLGRALGRAPSTVSVLRGSTRREKVVRIEGASIEEVWTLLKPRRS
jgi:uncharacterized protein (TIGR00251 family)